MHPAQTTIRPTSDSSAEMVSWQCEHFQVNIVRAFLRDSRTDFESTVYGIGKRYSTSWPDGGAPNFASSRFRSSSDRSASSSLTCRISAASSSSRRSRSISVSLVQTLVQTDESPFSLLVVTADRFPLALGCESLCSQLCKLDVRGSSPLGSTFFQPLASLASGCFCTEVLLGGGLLICYCSPLWNQGKTTLKYKPPGNVLPPTVGGSSLRKSVSKPAPRQVSLVQRISTGHVWRVSFDRLRESGFYVTGKRDCVGRRCAAWRSSRSPQ